MEALIRADKISKDFSLGEITVHALKRVSFSLFPEEMIVILGPSGSGKSTMLNILGGIETATEGELYYEGEPLKWDDKKTLTEYRRRHIGFVFQSFQLLPNLNALENVMLPLELQGKPAQKLAKEHLERVGLGTRLQHYPKTLSGGERQRVALARAFVMQPDILFADEPTGSLDANNGALIMDLMFELQQEKQSTLVLVTHDPVLAARCEAQIELQAGGIIRASL